MKTIHFLKNRLFPLLATIGLLACGGSGNDEMLLEPPTQPESYIKAQFNAYSLQQGQSKQIALDNLVITENIAHWQLDSVVGKPALGEIQLQEQAFDYHAHTAGVSLITYQVSGEGNYQQTQSATGRLLITVNALDESNTPPTAEHRVYELKSSDSLKINLLELATDADGDPLSMVHFETESPRFQLASDQQTLTYQPKGFAGIEKAMFAISDNQGGYAIGMLVVHSIEEIELPNNTPPVAQDHQVTLERNQSQWHLDLAQAGLITDADLDPLRLVEIYGSQERVRITSAHEIVYQADDYVGIDQFSYSITDDQGGFAIGTITVDVPAPFPPTLTAKTHVMLLDKNQSQVVDLTSLITASNVEDWQLTDIIRDSNQLGLVTDKQAKEFTYFAQKSGTTTLTYRVQAGELSATGTVLIVVSENDPNNTPPKAGYLSTTTANDTELIIDLMNHISDINPFDRLTIVEVLSPSERFTLLADKRTLSFQPNGFIGIDQASFVVTDNRGGYAIGMVIVESQDLVIVPENNPPTATNANYQFDKTQHSAWHIDLVSEGLIHDIDGDPLQIVELYASNQRASILNQHEIIYQAGEFEGTDQFSYVITDGQGGFAIATMTLTVKDAPLPTLEVTPHATLMVVGQNKHIDLSQFVSVRNGESWQLVGEISDSNQLGEIRNQTATSFDYHPTQAGETELHYIVQTGEVRSQGVILAVVAPPASTNQPPSVQHIVLNDHPNTQTLTLDLVSASQASDPDADPLTVQSLITPSSRFELQADQRTVTYTPHGYLGVDQASFVISDGQGGYSIGMLVINTVSTTPESTNQVPIANDYQGSFDTTLASHVAWRLNLYETWGNDGQRLIHDPDGDPLHLTAIYASNGRATIEAPHTIVYQNNGFIGNEQFSYVVSDDKGGYAIGTISLEVKGKPASGGEAMQVLIKPKMINGQVHLGEVIDLNQLITTNNVKSWQRVGEVTDSANLGDVVTPHIKGFTYVPRKSGTTELTYQIDADGHLMEGKVLVVVGGNDNSTNRAPTVYTLNDPIHSSTTSQVFQLSSKWLDPDGDTLRVVDFLSPTEKVAGEHFELDRNSNLLTFHPKGVTGAHYAMYTVTDDRGGFTLGQIVFNVLGDTAANTAPRTQEYRKLDWNVDVDSDVWTFDLAANLIIYDNDGDQLEITDIFSFHHRVELIDETTIRYTAGEFRGIDQFSYAISDGKGGTAIGQILLFITDNGRDGNTPPKASSFRAESIDNKSVTPLIISVAPYITDADPHDSHQLHWLEGAMGQVSFSPDSVLDIHYLPKPNQTGEDSFNYVVQDSKGAMAMATITVPVVQNLGLIATPAHPKTHANLPLTLDLANYIQDDQVPVAQLVIDQLSLPDSPATASFNGHLLSYQPNGFVGTEILTYRLSNGTEFVQGRITIQVDPAP